jgi:hypothetical protein
MTLINCEIYYLSAVNYDHAISSDLIFLSVNIYPGPGKEGLTANFFSQFAALPYNISFLLFAIFKYIERIRSMPLSNPSVLLFLGSENMR